MSIDLVTAPATTPSAVGDYTAQNNLIAALALAAQGAARVVGSNVVKGAVFLVGGSVYLAAADTSISGAASDYVKLTITGTTLVPSFVASLSGVTWSSTWNGYYDVSGNLYEFDELKALAGAAIAAASLRAIGGKNLAAGWAAALIAALGTGWTTILHKTIIDFSTGSAGAYGTHSINSLDAWVIPAGLYMLSCSGTLYNLQLQIKNSSTGWDGINGASGLILADGTNYRIYNLNSGSETV